MLSRNRGRSNDAEAVSIQSAITNASMLLAECDVRVSTSILCRRNRKKLQHPIIGNCKQLIADD